MVCSHSGGDTQLDCGRGVRDHLLERSDRRAVAEAFVTLEQETAMLQRYLGIQQVRFADRPCEVGTREGVVHAEAGDAIVTGMFGEHWPVGRDFFDAKYEAVSPLQAGAPGSYLSLPIEVIATPMHAPFEVVLADGHSRLHGQSGDWLVDYGDGNLGIVNAEIFKATYEILEEV